MAPSHVVFGDDGAQAPKYASTSTASPSTSQRPLHAANPNGTPLSKRPRVSHFTEEDEEERDGLRKASASKGKGKLAQEKELRRAEADRLKPGRTQLPIWEGKCVHYAVPSRSKQAGRKERGGARSMAGREAGACSSVLRALVVWRSLAVTLRATLPCWWSCRS